MSEEVAYKLWGLINKYLSQKNDGQHGYIEPLDQEPYYNWQKIKRSEGSPLRALINQLTN